ncbi:MAG: hypothetical protein AAFZ07_03995 [Actinomycetota bacterium]
MSDAEGAVRLYLMYLDDPTNLRDEAEIKKRKAEVERSKDPIDKLKAVAALKAAETVDGDQYRQGFLKHARSWAGAEGVPVSAFQELGVSAADLADAGFEVPQRRSSRSAQRSRRVSAEQVRTGALAMTESFTLAQLQETTGGSIGTIRKVVGELVEAGELGDLGPDPSHDGRGRAPSLFAKS